MKRERLSLPKLGNRGGKLALSLFSTGQSRNIQKEVRKQKN